MEVETDIPDDPQEKINSMLERLEDTREKNGNRSPYFY